MPDRARTASAASGPAVLRALAAPEPARGRAFRALAALVTLAALAGAAHAYAHSPRRLVFPDAFDYAQMGRQIARGEGMTSLQAFPYALGWLADRERATAPPWPNLWRFPLPTWIRAASLAALGESDAAAIAPSLLFSALTATLLFALANRLAGPAAGLAAAAIWTLAASQRELATTGLSEPGAALFAAALALAALRARDGGVRAAAGAGALLGAALLHRTNLAALAPLALVLAAGGAREHRLARAAVLVAAALAVALPWWLHTAHAWGEPFLNLTTDRGLLRLALGRDPFYALRVEDADGALARSLALYPSGWTWAWLRDAAPRMLGRDLGALAPIALVAAVVDARAARTDARAHARALVAALAASGLVATALVFAPIYPDVMRFYWPYAPLVAAVACAGALARVPGAWRAAAAAAGVLAFALLAPRERAAPLLGAAEDAPARETAEIARFVPPGGVVASDVSFAVAWQAERPSVRFVGGWDVLAAIDWTVVPVDAIHLSPSAPASWAAPLARPPLANLFERAPTQAPETGQLWLARRLRAAAPAAGEPPASEGSRR